MKDLVARDVMSSHVLTVPPDMTVHELSVFLIDNQISGAPVADERGRLLGLVSLTDIAENDGLRAEEPGPERSRSARRRARAVDLDGLPVQRADLLVRDIMTPATFSIPEDTPVAQVAQTMIAGRIHRLLVTRDHHVVGIVTSLDLLGALVEGPRKATRRAPRPGITRALLVLLLAAAGASACARAGTGNAARPADPGAAAVASALPPGHPPIGSAPHAIGAAPHGSMTAPHAAKISGTITLAPAVAAQAPARGALYVIARGGEERQIVAVRREENVTFPHAFELSAADAMTRHGGAAFGGPLEITARLSRSGDAAPAPGDLEGHAANVNSGDGAVRLQIDAVRR